MTNPIFERLRARLAEIHDLRSATALLYWDQQTIMPPAGAAARAEQVATLSRMTHELFVAEETGTLLEELRGYEDSLDPDSFEASLIRVTRRDYEKSVRVPADLRAEMSRAGSHGMQVWARAKAASDFGAFLPALERNLDLRFQYVACFDAGDEPYDVLLDDYEEGMKTAEVRRIFDELKEELVPLIAASSGREVESLGGEFPIDAQREISLEVLGLFGHRPDAWRLDPTLHPFASGGGIDDIRITTHYEPGDLDSLFATMHEYGHGLYEHQVAAELDRSPLASGVSLGLHESQSRMWENLVGRSLPFWRMFYPAAPGDVPGRARRRRPRRVLPVREPGAAVAHPDPRGRGHLQHAHHPAVRARAGDHRRPRRARRPARGVEPADVGLPRHRGAGRRARGAPGRALVGRVDGLLPDVRARQRDVGADLGAAP